MQSVNAFRRGIDAGVAAGGQLCISVNGERVVDVCHGASFPDLIYDLASLTKVLATVYLVARARQYGLCALDDPLSRYVPTAAGEVTLRHALEHSSGYPAHRHFYDEIPTGTADAYAWCVREAGRTPLESAPGTRLRYGDLGFILLGAAVERMFAEPLRALIRRDVHGVFFPSDTERASDRFASTAHLGLTDDRPAVLIPPGMVHDGNCRLMGGAAGHAGLFGTARQVTAIAERWLAALRGEDEAWLAPRFAAETFALARVEGHATGWDIATPGGATGDLWPKDTRGHLGFTGTSVWMSPSRRLVCTLLTNRGCTLPELKTYRRAVYRAVIEDAADAD